MTSITELTLQTAPPALWKEWLTAYFDGVAHDVGARTGIVFPKANIAFGQGSIAQPLDAAKNPAQAVQTSAEIRVICLPLNAGRTWNTSAADAEHMLATDSVLFQFQIRASKSRAKDGEYLCARISELLFAILNNPETRYPLARHGITHLQPKPPSPVPSTDWAMFQINCNSQLQYPVLLGDSNVA